MDLTIAGVLTVDGLTNGAVYALLGMGIVLLFSVTRVIFLPQGEFVAYGALTLAIFQTGQVPGTVWLLFLLALVAALMELVTVWRHRGSAAPAVRAALLTSLPALVVGLVSLWAAPQNFPLVVQALLIVSVGVHFAMTGLGLLFFGAEGFRNPSFWDAYLDLGPLSLSGQALIIFLASAALIVLLWLFFERSLYGKALQATAVNRLGARLMGISTTGAGQLTFAMAALIGGLSGLLIGPTTTVFYDSGFLIGLKGFVAAVVAGLHSYPGALLGALGVGLIESFSSFWASAFKEVIVFTLVLPVLLWRSLRSPHAGEEH